MKLKSIIVASSVLVLVGCGSILGPQNKRPVQYYQLADSRTDTKSLDSCTSYGSNLSIYVSPPEVVQPYNDYKMYYQSESYMVNSYSYSQWAIPVSGMVNQAIVQSLTTSCAFRSINSSSTVASDNYRLLTSVRMIRHELNDNGKSYAHIIISSQLINIKEAKVIDTFIFDNRMPTDGTPLGFVQSSSNLMASYDKKLLPWMKKAIAEDK